MKLFGSLERPIIAVVGFNLFTLLVFLTAPVRWDTDNLPLLVFFVILCQLLILVGFQLGRSKGRLAHPKTKLLFSSVDKSAHYLFVFYSCTFLIIYAFKLGFSPFDISGMFYRVLMGVLDRQYGYYMALRSGDIRIVPWTVFFLVSIFDQLFFIVGFLQWRLMSSFKKFLFVGFICIELFFWMSRGTSFGVVAMATTLLFSTMFGKYNAKFRISKALNTFLLVFFLFVGSIAFFSYNLYSRSGNVERNMQSYEFGIIIDDHIMLSIVPEPLQPSYMNVVSYLGQGYYHTSLAFDLDFKSTHGLCNNPAINSLGAIFGYDCWEDSYMHKLASKGVDEYAAWHSAYTWYASDVSFYGVPPLLFLLAYLFGFSWAMSLKGDLLSKIVFIILGNMLLYLFANNSYLSNYFYSLMVLLPFWIITRLFGSARRRSVQMRIPAVSSPVS